MMSQREEYLKLLGIPNWRLRGSNTADTLIAENEKTESYSDISVTDESSKNYSLLDIANNIGTDRQVERKVSSPILPEELPNNRAESVTDSERPKTDSYLADCHLTNNQNLSTLETEIQQCQRCKLAQDRQRSILGRGNRKTAQIIFITDIPLKVEELEGQPIVGDTEVIFSNILKTIHLTYDDCYITPFIKCRPAELVELTTNESDQCRYFLKTELHGVDPNIPIVLLGRDVSQALLNSQKPLSRLRQQRYEMEFNHQTYRVYVTDAPTSLLKMQQQKQAFWNDLKWIKQDINA